MEDRGRNPLKKAARFRHFINSEIKDPSVVFVPERAQIRPAFPEEKPDVIPAKNLAKNVAGSL